MFGLERLDLLQQLSIVFTRLSLVSANPSVQSSSLSSLVQKNAISLYSNFFSVYKIFGDAAWTSFAGKQRKGRSGYFFLIDRFTIRPKWNPGFCGCMEKISYHI